jgi:hypothetical protein
MKYAHYEELIAPLARIDRVGDSFLYTLISRMDFSIPSLQVQDFFLLVVVLVLVE